jgi:2-dehydro-3-deoxygluconokinase
VALEACKAAKKHGTIISYDLNYRPSLWKDIGGHKKAQEVNKEIAKYVDVMIGNEEDFIACLGFSVSGGAEDFGELDIEGYKTMLGTVSKEYPNFKVIASTLRTVKSASINDWTAICLAGGEIYTGLEFNGTEILDRVGGGDSFASGLIYGFLSGKEPGTALNYGICHGALAMTTPGDTSMASLSEVEALMKGAGARVVR